MTDKEIVEKAKEAEKRTGFGELVHSPISKGVNSAYSIGFIEGMVEYRNSLQEEPVSKEIGDYDHKAVMKTLHPELKEEPVSEDLGEYINELSKQFPEVSFAKLSRIAVRVAKWQEEQFEKKRLKHCDELTKEQAQIESNFVTQHLKKNNRTPTFIDAIEYGMKMQKEQMMAKSIDVEVMVDAGGYPYIPQMELYDYDKDEPLAKEGEKVKVIVIKED